VLLQLLEHAAVQADERQAGLGSGFRGLGCIAWRQKRKRSSY
jgi:hypothetical protein